MPRRTVRPFDAREPQSLQALDSAALVQRVRSLLAEAQALSARLAALNEVAVTMQADLDIEKILQALTRQARWIIDFQSCSIALCEGELYYVRMLLGEPPAASEQRGRPFQAGAIGRALRGRHALLLHELSAADEAPAGMHSALILPLRSGGEHIGTLNFYARSAHHYTQDDLRIASALAVQVAVMLQNVRLFVATMRARDQLSTVLESIGDAVLVIDQAGRILLLNTVLRQMLCLPESDFVGLKAIWLCRAARTHERRLFPQGTIRAMGAAWRAQPTSGASGTIQLSDGRHLEWAYAPLIATGAVAGGVLTFRDISDRVALEQLRDDMLHMLVHDLRTPLTGLIMGLDFLTASEEMLSAEERQQMLQRTRLAARQLLGQVSTILDVRKLEAGRLELERGHTSIAYLVDQSLSAVLSLAQQEQIELSQRVDPELPLVSLDARLLQRVLENLLGNALKFTPTGGHICVSAQMAEGNRLEILVEDSGSGVPDELREHIFEKYSQAPGAARRSGTGLGLAFCKLIVEAHGGQIGVRNAPVSGSIFWLRLPIDEM